MPSVDVKMKGVVKVNTALHIRNRPSMSGSIMGYLYNGDELDITKKDGEWYYSTTTHGWSHSDYITITSEETPQGVEVAEVDKEKEEELKKKEEKKRQQAELNRQLELIGEELNSTKISDKEILDGLVVNNLNGIYGIPYQFLASVDPRMENSVMGRKYTERIVSKLPLLCITPGKVEFMSNYSKEEQEGFLKNVISGDTETDVSSIITHNGRYFTFGFSYPDYFKYVNGLCRAGARFLGIQNVELDVGGERAKAANFNWENALNKNLKATVMSQKFIGFYMDSADSVSESFSNETTQSQLSSTVNGFSDIAREIGFLLGAGAGKKISLMDQDKEKEVMAQIDEISKSILENNLLTNIGRNFHTVAMGGKLLFPEIWADSSFSRSFDISIKLRTPDKDKVSWYLNIYVPLCHLIALTAAHETDNQNGYYSPFLIRAFYKGLFNVDMGIVQDMSITKGKESAWTIDGLPTEIDINLTIKDLYNMLHIVPGDEAKNFVSNSLLMDYIANTCGININKMDIERTLEIYWILFSNRIYDLPNKAQTNVQNALDNLINNFYNRVLDLLI